MTLKEELIAQPPPLRLAEWQVLRVGNPASHWTQWYMPTRQRNPRSATLR